MNGLKLSRIGAIFYILWGVLHIMLGIMILNINSNEGTVAMLAFFGLKDEIQLTHEAANVMGSLGAQHAANLAIFGIIAIIIAVKLIWNRYPLGFWLNLIMIGLADIAFIIAFFIPGYIRGMAGVMGPALFILGAIFSGLGLLKGISNNSKINIGYS